MNETLKRLFVEGEPFDQQSACIEEFFNAANRYWENTPFSDQEGSDEETQQMISHYKRVSEPTGTVLEMLNSWAEDGF